MMDVKVNKIRGDRHEEKMVLLHYLLMKSNNRSNFLWYYWSLCDDGFIIQIELHILVINLKVSINQFFKKHFSLKKNFFSNFIWPLQCWILNTLTPCDLGGWVSECKYSLVHK